MKLTKITISILMVLAVIVTVSAAQNVRVDSNHYENAIFNVSEFNGTSMNLEENVTASFYFGDGSQLTNLPSGTGDNASFNQTLTDGLYAGIEWDYNQTEALNPNSTQMDFSNGNLNIKESWFTTLWNTIFGTKTTDDLTEGSTNLYDNQTWNETRADSKYSLIGTGDNESWNQSLADTLYADTIWGYNQTIPAMTYTDEVNNSQSSWIDTVFLKIADMFTKSEITGMIDGNLTEANDYTDGVVSANNASWTTTFNSTYDAKVTDNETWNEALADTLYADIQWDYNQTIPANTYTDAQVLIETNERIGNDTEIRTNFVSADNGNRTEIEALIDLKANLVDGNTFTGQQDFNGGWTSGGASIIDGDIFAQTLYVYNLSAIGVDSFRINGSLYPQDGFDDTFEIGNETRRWNRIVAGTGDSSFAGDVGIGTTNPSNELHIEATNPVQIIQSDSIFGISSLRFGQTPVYGGQTASITWSGTSFGSHQNRLSLNSIFGEVHIQDTSSGDTFINDVGGDVILVNGGGKVGIGTASPDIKLEIEDTAGTILKITPTGEAAASDAIISFNLDRGHIGYDGSELNMLVQAGSAKGFQVNVNSNTFGGGTRAFEISSTGDAEFTQKVGIGTTSFSEAFEVNGNSILDGLVQFGKYGSEGGEVRWANTTGTGYQWFADVNSADQLRIRHSDFSTLMVLDDATGNIGMGTNPTDPLTVRASSIDAGITVRESDNGADAIHLGADGFHGKIELLRSNVVNHIIDAFGTTIFNQLGDDIDFRIEGDTQVNLFKLDAGLDSIGIGTGTPNSLLHLSKDYGNLTLGSDSIGGYSQGEAIFGINWYNNDVSGSGPQTVARIASHVDPDVTFGYGGDLRFFTNDGLSGEGTDPVERMRITVDGNVGIGSDDTPINLFEVSDADGGMTQTPNGLFGFNTNNALGGTLNDNVFLGEFTWGNVNNDFRNGLWVRRDASAPGWTTVRLHDAIMIDGSFTTPGVDTKVWYERDPGNTLHAWGNAATTFLQLNSAGLFVTQKLVVSGTGDSSFVGNVGIGIADPTASLHVISPTNARGIKIQNAQTNAGSFLVFLSDDGTEDSYIGNNPSNTGQDELIIATNATTRMTFDGVGNIGIGTTDPLELLQIGDKNVGDKFLSFQTNNAAERGILYYLQDGTTVRGFMKWDAAEDLLIKGDNIVFSAGQGADNAMFIQDLTGNVAIGHISPNANLHIQESSSNAIIQIETTAGNIQPYVYYNEGDNAEEWLNGIDYNTGEFMWKEGSNVWASATEKMRLSSGGDLTITGDLIKARQVIWCDGNQVTEDTGTECCSIYTQSTCNTIEKQGVLISCALTQPSEIFLAFCN